MDIDVFSTCPQSSQEDSQSYLRRVADVARWSEEAGCKGILVYTDNSLVDPWLVSQVIIENTKNLCPLVAVQPVYMHPYTAAKMIASFGFIYNRKIYLNMVAGGFKNDLTSLGDDTPHDRRYDRAIEYTLIIKQLLAADNPASFSGEFYRVDNLRMTPRLPPELFPGILISGSSEEGVAAARRIGATAIRYPKPSSEYLFNSLDSDLDSGVRVGVIARDNDDLAWQIAHARFPEDRKGQITHQLAMKVSDSVWHKQLSEMGEQHAAGRNPYWLGPFQNYKTFCPYLVGSYQRVAEELSRYIRAGYRTFILDIPPNLEELTHINIVFKEAITMASAGATAATAN
ncbi:MAG: LLM class flavin-dependent oxidoreductase [Blastocatellales bacterium]